MHFKGETTVQIDGQAVRLRLDINAMCALEEITGQNAFDLLEQVESGKPGFKLLRAFFWAMARCDRPELTLLEAGDMMAQAPEAVISGIRAAMPVAEAAEDTSGNPTPATRPSAA